MARWSIFAIVNRPRRTLARHSREDLVTTGVHGFSRDGSTAYLLSSVGVNASRLVRVDLATGAETVLAEESENDVAYLLSDPDTLELQSVVFLAEREQWVHVDLTLGAEIDALRSRLPGEIGISRSERTDRRWLVSDTPSDGPVRYYVYNRDDTSLTFLFAHKPALDDYDLATMQTFSFLARDGLTIHGYVTYPPAVEPAALPAVVNVHGGPWYRDVWGYDPEAQWLANRGYACIQVNYRGSTGYGKAFGNAGDREWGRAMHPDLVDAVTHLTDEGHTDPQRVGIRRVVRRLRCAGRRRIHSRGVPLRRGHGGAVEPHHTDRFGAGVLETDDRAVPHKGRQSRDRARFSLGALAAVPR